MPQTQINCPNCRQPVLLEVEQLFDLNQDPASKQRLLSGQVNYLQCPHCNFQGNIATPIVYHDPEKELLLTFVPAEIGLPREEQEKVIGALINQVINNLPQEQRKGYLLSPVSVLTQQGLIERVLEADGITKEMIQAQEEKIRLLQRLLTASVESREQIAQEEDEILDAEFFGLLARLIEGSLASGDEAAAADLSDLQAQLLPLTTFGSEIQSQLDEMQAAAQTLQDAGEDLTRERLLDLVIEAPNESRRQALVSLARGGMDYSFFQLLSERIDRAEGEEKEELIVLREQLLEMTREIDRQMETRLSQARQLLQIILRSHNVSEATMQNISAIDQFFITVLNEELERTSQEGDQDRLAKLQQIVAVLDQASQPNEEIAFIQALVDAPDEEAREQLLDSRLGEITPEFLQVVTALMSQPQSEGNEELAEILRSIHRMALRKSMQASLRGP